VYVTGVEDRIIQGPTSALACCTTQEYPKRLPPDEFSGLQICQKCVSGLGSARTPLEELTALPAGPLAANGRGPHGRGVKGQKYEGRRKGRDGEVERGKGERRKGMEERGKGNGT